jgi:hypothetical protein
MADISHEDTYFLTEKNLFFYSKKNFYRDRWYVSKLFAKDLANNVTFLAKKLTFLACNTVIFLNNFINKMVFKKNTNFFAENRQKSLKK